MTAPWPLDCDLQLCRETWNSSTSEERQRLCEISGDDVVMYFKVAEAFLKNKTCNLYEIASERIAAIAWESRKCGLMHVLWETARPRSAMMDLDFCADPKSVDFIFAKSARNFDSFFRAIGVSQRGIPRCGSEEASTTWEGFRKDFFAVMLSQLIVRCRKKRDGDLLLLLKAVETVADLPATRLWPSKKRLLELRKLWSALSPKERVSACKVEGASCWLVRATEMLADSCMTKACLKSGLFQRGSLDSAEYERLKLGSFEGSGCHDKVELLQMTEDFASSTGALEHLLKHAVKMSGDRDAIVSIALVASQASVSVAQTDLPVDLSVGWKHVARVTCTLTLASLERFFDAWQRREAQRLQTMEMEALRLREKETARKSSRREKRRLASSHVATECHLSEATVPKILWERHLYNVVRTFVDVEDESSSSVDMKKLRKCTSSFL